MLNILNKILANNKYKGYSQDLKEYCLYRDKYQKYWNEQGKYIEGINKNYSLFINNNLDMNYFNTMLEYCYKYLEIMPIIEESRKEDTRINRTEYPKEKSNLAYKKMALAYEKLGNYEKAISICEEAIKNGYTNDDTKSGYVGRIEKLKLKLK